MMMLVSNHVLSYCRADSFTVRRMTNHTITYGVPQAGTPFANF
jgi:hypothetical protein